MATNGPRQGIDRTGQLIINAFVDPYHSPKTNTGADDNRHALQQGGAPALVSEGDMCFIVIGTPTRNKGPNGELTPVIARIMTPALQRRKPEEFRFAGFALATADGAVGVGRPHAEVALQAGGTITFTGAIMGMIRSGASLRYAMPIPGLGNGRMTPYLCEYKPSHSVKSPAHLHRLATLSFSGAKVNDSETAVANAAVKLIDALMVTALEIVLQMQKAENGGQELTMKEKLLFAEKLGIIEPQTGSPKDVQDRKQMSLALKKKVTDVVFGMRYNKAQDNSCAVADIQSFKVMRSDSVHGDQRVSAVGRKQRAAITNVLCSIMTLYDAEQQTHIGWTPTGGSSETGIDILIK